MNNEELIDIKTLRPFRRFIYTIGALPSSYLMSMTYDEQLIWLCNYLSQTVIPALNNNGLAVEELQAKYIELKSYVDDYFENLDVQEEINNKLDEMALDGTLENLISQYIQLATTYVYNNVSEMKEATNLVNGSFARTSGFYEYNDNGGANYKIRTITNEDVIDNIHLFALTNDNTLVAELIEEEKINIKQLGAISNDNEVDNADILNYALNNFHKVYIPLGTYYVSDDLQIGLSDIEIYGDGEDSILHIANKDTGTMVNINGKHNIKLHALKIENDSTRSDTTIPDVRIMNFNNCYNLLFENFYMNNIYSKGIEIINSHDITFINSKFTNATYSMVTILSECYNITVDNCVFDTCTTTYLNSYLFSTGFYDQSTTASYLTKNITVKNSKFLNNPLWEGLESHGCENLLFDNNYIYNCRIGIMTNYDTRKSVNSYSIDNVTITNNVIEAPDGIMLIGIACSGNNDIYRKNVKIDNNVINNANVSSSANSIQINYVKNYQCNNNHINNFSRVGIYLYMDIDGEVNNNSIIKAYDGAHYGIRSINSYFTRVENNYINQDSIDITSKYIHYGVGANEKCGLVMPYNNICNVKTKKYYFNDNTLINPTSATNTNRMGMKGVKCVDESDIIKAYYSDDVIRSVSATISATISATAGDTILDFGTTNIIQQLAPLQEIVITGAGTSGANLTTQIIEYISPRKFRIKDPIVTSVTNANIQTTASTLVIL